MYLAEEEVEGNKSLLHSRNVHTLLKETVQAERNKNLVIVLGSE